MPIGTRTPEKFAKHLQGVEWPATKEELLARARSTAAPPEVLEELMMLPGQEFETREQLLVAYANEYGRR